MDNNKPLSKEARSMRMGIYRHFKGHNVKVIGIARHSEDPKQEFVVYNHDEKFWIRPLKMFLEHVDKDDYKGPRFAWLGEKI